LPDETFFSNHQRDRRYENPKRWRGSMPTHPATAAPGVTGAIGHWQFNRPKKALQPQFPSSLQQVVPNVAEQLGQLAATHPEPPPVFPPPEAPPEGPPPLPGNAPVFGTPPFPCPPGPGEPPSGTAAPSSKSNRGTSSDVAQATSSVSDAR
jgi:hypothetical protein